MTATTTGSGEYHLKHEDAKKLAEKIVVAYKREHGYAPRELFIHGETRINKNEWYGFRDGVPSETNIVGVRICSENKHRHPQIKS